MYSSIFAPLKIRSNPEPNGPAKPVPLLHPATILGGNILIYPNKIVI